MFSSSGSPEGTTSHERRKDMTEPSQYFKGRTVQEQMDEVIGYVDVRSAEVATTAIASDVAQVHQDMLDADADASAAAASAAAAAGTLANAVKKVGEASQSIAGDIAVAGTLSGGLITGTRVEAPTPVFNADAANKHYVDAADAALKTYVDNQDALDVKLAGNQTIADVKTFSSSPVVPTVATGTNDTKAANGTKVKNELDNYAPMLRTTGNQVFSGIKKAGSNGFFRKMSASLDMGNPPTSGSITDEIYVMEDTAGTTMVQNFNSFTAGAQTIYQISTKFPFIEGNDVKKVTGALWIAVYEDRASLFLRFADKNGTSHMKTIMTVMETDP